MRWLFAIVLAAGCYQHVAEQDCTIACGPGSECPDGTHCSAGRCGAGTCGPSDGGSGDGSCTTFGHAGFQPCVQTLDIGIELDGTTLPGTYTCQMQAQGRGPDVCVLAFASIEISGLVTVAGPDPIALVGRDFIQIDPTGVLDASSHTQTMTGAGANPNGCATGAIDGEASAGGAAGGAGGTFASSGGFGGDGTGIALGGTPATPVMPPFALRGGCTGGQGGAGTGTATPGGPGGGAVALYSNGRIEIDGLVDASGAGGKAPMSLGGGGGGGAGGFIGIDGDPAMYVLTGTIWADGGGGSSGCDATVAGNAGHEATASPGSPPMPGAGGQSQSAQAGDGGTGGSGKAEAAIGGQSIAAGYSGGGGGGGYGVIAIFGYAGASPLMTIDPDPIAP